MVLARLIAGVVMAVQVVGCAYFGVNPSPTVGPQSPAPSAPASASVPPTPMETATAAPSEPSASFDPTPSVPSPTATLVQPTPQPTPSGDSSPLPSPSHSQGLAASNRFWENWYDTCWFGAAVFPIVSSLEEITSQSDLVVRGTISDLYSRRTVGWDVAYVTISIAEVLKGDPVSREAGTVEAQIGFGSSADLDELRSNLPVHDHLWFLVHESTRDPGGNLAEESKTYYPTDYQQVSVLRDIGGTVEVVMPEAIANAYSRRQFPVPLDGTSFEELIDRVRQLTDGASAAAQLRARQSPHGAGDTDRFFAC